MIATKIETGRRGTYTLTWGDPGAGSAEEQYSCSLAFDVKSALLTIEGSVFQAREGNVFVVEYGAGWTAEVRQLPLKVETVVPPSRLLERVRAALPGEDAVRGLEVRPSVFVE